MTKDEGDKFIEDMEKPYCRLVGSEVIPCTIDEWCKDGHKRILQSTHRHLWISTVFMGIKHYGGVFETMVFLKRRGRGDGQSDLHCTRSWTLEGAKKNHKMAVELCKTGQITRGMTRHKTRSKALKSIKKFLLRREAK